MLFGAVITTFLACLSLSYANLEKTDDDQAPITLGCPEKEVLSPCVGYPYRYGCSVVCEHIDNVRDLENVFINSKQYIFERFELNQATLPFLPGHIFDDVAVSIFVLKNVTLQALFNVPPSDLNDLIRLEMYSSKIIGRMSWHVLQNVTNIRALGVYDTPLKDLGSDFNENVSKKALYELYLLNTSLKKLNPGVLKGYSKLNVVSITINKLQEITRDIFDRPFNGRSLYLDQNNLKTLPADMFMDMPNLHTVTLRYNHLSTLPQSIFGGQSASLTFIALGDNPLKCDCDLYWLIHYKPYGLSGTCATPKKLFGREIGNLTSDDFNCM